MPICYLLLVININLPPILHLSKFEQIIGQIFASDRGVLTLTPSLGVIPRPR